MGLFDGLFGKKQKSKEDYGGVRPYGSLEDTPYGKTYSTELANRLKGIGVGFAPEYVSATTSPYAQSMRSQFANYTTPQIESAASARGMGRSSLVPQQLRLGSQEVGEKIGELVAQKYGESEAQKRAEINDALAKMGAMNESEAGVRQSAANWETNLRAQHQAESRLRAAEEDAFRNQLIAGGSTLLGGGLGLLSGGVKGAMRGMGYSTSQDDLDDLNLLNSYAPSSAVRRSPNILSPYLQGTLPYSMMNYGGILRGRD